VGRNIIRFPPLALRLVGTTLLSPIDSILVGVPNMEPEQTSSMLMTGRMTRQQVLHGYDVLIAAQGYLKVYGLGKDSWDDGVCISRWTTHIQR
jgi:hypothetical protein